MVGGDSGWSFLRQDVLRSPLLKGLCYFLLLVAAYKFIGFWLPMALALGALSGHVVARLNKEGYYVYVQYLELDENMSLYAGVKEIGYDRWLMMEKQHDTTPLASRAGNRIYVAERIEKERFRGAPIHGMDSFSMIRDINAYKRSQELNARMLGKIIRSASEKRIVGLIEAEKYIDAHYELLDKLLVTKDFEAYKAETQTIEKDLLRDDDEDNNTIQEAS